MVTQTGWARQVGASIVNGNPIAIHDSAPRKD